MGSLYRLGRIGVNSSARTVDWSLIFRDEGDIGLNSPTVQFEASGFPAPFDKGRVKTVRIEPERQRIYRMKFNPTRVEFPAACGVKEIGNSIPDTPLLAAG